MNEVRHLTLAGLADGTAAELWQAALTRVLENIEDPNTDHKAKRTIALTFTFTADEERRVGQVEIACATKLAGVKGLRVPVYFGRHHGVLAAVEAPQQKDLFTQPAGGPRPLAATPGGAA